MHHSGSCDSCRDRHPFHLRFAAAQRNVPSSEQTSDSAVRIAFFSALVNPVFQPKRSYFPLPFFPSRYQKGKTNLDFTEARDSEWQWQQLGHMQVCTSPQTDNHASTSPLSFLHAGCPSCRPTNSVKALKATPIRSYLTSIDQANLAGE